MKRSVLPWLFRSSLSFAALQLACSSAATDPPDEADSDERGGEVDSRSAASGDLAEGSGGSASGGGSMFSGGASPLAAGGEGLAAGGSDAAAGRTFQGAGGLPGGPGGSLLGSGGQGSACELVESGPITSSSDGQVIENLRIVTNGHPALTITHDDVVVQNVLIEHENARGIVVSGADGVFIQKVSVLHTGAPAFGQNSSDDLINIECQNSDRFVLERARLEKGSSGVYLIGCPDSELRFLEGHDFRGPYPRGQLVQWNKSDRGLLEDFSVLSPPGSWPEDNINVYQSKDAVVRRGLVDGNNAPSGVGVIFDGGTSTGLVQDVDAVHMGNGCFSGIAAAADVTFERTRCSDNICRGQDGREAPRSNSLMWAGNPELTGQRILDSVYQNSCNGNITWPADSFSVIEVSEADFEIRRPLGLDFCWE